MIRSGFFSYTTSIPDTHKDLILPGAANYFVTGGFGEALLSGLEGPGFRVWQQRYEAAATQYSPVLPEAEGLQLPIALKGAWQYRLGGEKEIRIPEGHFNLLSDSREPMEHWMEAGKKYLYCSLHLSAGYLAGFTNYFAALGPFLEEAAKGQGNLFSASASRITPEMILVMRDLLQNDFAGEMKTMYLQYKVPELLLLALSRIAPSLIPTGEIRLHQYDIDKIREAREYLLLNMEHPLTVIELSHKVGINDFKLKKGFKQLYGVTIFDFLLEARMDKARTLLLETDTPVHEIAFATGYKNVSSFTAAFKKKMGYPPSALKRSKEE